MQQQRTTNSQFPGGKHPYLKRNGEPISFFTRKGSYRPELDPSNFSLDGKLGRILRSRAFANFMNPIYDSNNDPGRSTVEIWNWLTWGLDLNPWKNQTSADLDWLDERLEELPFLCRKQFGRDHRWVLEGC
jgi:hypothetical protein